MSDLGVIAKKLAGRFVVIDGPDGAGKTTQVQRLAAGLADAGAAVLTVRDPGGTEVGDLIRQILLAPNGARLDIAAETLLFMASRAQLAAERIRPALADGRTVLGDRFISSTCAYQGANGVDLDRIIDLGRFAVGATWPDLTVILDLPAEEGLARIGVLGKDKNQRWMRKRKVRKDDGRADSLFNERPDAMEARSLEFHRKVREIFVGLAAVYPRPVEVIRAADDSDAVFARLVEVLGRVDL